MRSQIVLTTVLCLCFSFTQALEIKGEQTRDVRTCQMKAIIEDVEEFVNSTWDLFDEVYMSYKDLMVEAAECLNDGSGVVSCVVTNVLSWVRTVTPEFAKYYAHLVTWSVQFVQDLSNCA